MLGMPILAVVAIGWPLAASAGLYKCARGDGSIIYQEDPCAAGRELRDFERDPATVSVVPFSTAPPAPAPTKSAHRRARPAGEHASRRPSARAAGVATAKSARDRAGNPAERKFLVPGIGEGEVVARIGRPDMSSGAGRRTVRWTYLPAPADPQTITTLTFELGRLVQVDRKVVPPQ
jgi:hypothetical protein